MRPRCMSAGGMVVYDPNHRPALWADDDDARDVDRARSCRSSTCCWRRLEDGRRLTDGGTPARSLEAFRAMGAREVVVTDGS